MSNCPACGGHIHNGICADIHFCGYEEPVEHTTPRCDAHEVNAPLDF